MTNTAHRIDPSTLPSRVRSEDKDPIYNPGDLHWGLAGAREHLNASTAMAAASMAQPWQQRLVGPDEYEQPLALERLGLEGWMVAGVLPGVPARMIMQRPHPAPVVARERYSAVCQQMATMQEPKADPYEATRRYAFRDRVSHGGYEWERTGLGFGATDAKAVAAPTTTGDHRHLWRRIDPPYTD